MKKRCPWPSDDPLMIEYHDKEWGVPLRMVNDHLTDCFRYRQVGS
ncbi:MAG: hypothetical protein WC956_02725 [bacterium]